MKKNKYKFPDLPKLQKQGLYDPIFEHDACGVGLAADINGEKGHTIVTQGLEILDRLGHRGAAGADPETGDGAGILVQIPDAYLREDLAKHNIKLPPEGQYGVGMTFLPMDKSKRQAFVSEVNKIVEQEGLTLLHWREVPVNPDSIGVLANKSRPYITQFFVASSNSVQEKDLELTLYVVRKQIEQSVENETFEGNEDFYISSLSCRKLVYKGLIMAHQLTGFYPDLADDNFKSAFALVHSRFSTNTLGTWKLAHPYRFAIHNGEINTHRGNVNWMSSREKAFQSEKLGKDIEKLLPIVKHGQSDTASLDNALELLVSTGRTLEHSLMMLIPEAWGDHIPMDPQKRAFYEYHSSMMEPWDGPALVIGTDGTKVCAILDRNGLRPCRYLVTKDGLLVMASETGVLDVNPEDVLYKERIYPGKMFLLDTKEGKIHQDEEIKSQLISRKPYEKWLSENRVFLEDIIDMTKADQETVDENLLIKLQNTFGYTLEDIRIILEPMAKTG